MKEVNIVSTIVGRGSDKQTTSKAPSMGAYALKSDVTALQSLFNDFLEGDDTDNVINRWNEVESFLNGISEDNTLTSILGDYIPIKGYTEILGEKNFTGGLKVNGSPIYYDTEKKYWKLEGDLLVTGGVSMYSNDTAFTPSTIMDAIAVDGTTISKEGGILKVIGDLSGGATTLGSLANVGSWADSVASQDRIMYQAANSSQWVAKNLSDLAVGGVTGNYLPLSGGTISGTLAIINEDVSLCLYRQQNNATPYIRFAKNATTQYGELGVYNDGRLVFWPLVSSQGGYGQWNTVWHSGNDGSGSGLDADLLDGYDNNSFFINRNIALNANTINTTLTPGCYHTSNYSPISGVYKYGTILNFRGGARQTQFYIPDGGQSYSNGGRLFFRDNWNANESITTAWYEIITSASVGSFNAGSATRVKAYTHDSGEKVIISGSRSDNTFPRYIYDNGWGLCLRWQEGNGVVHNGTIATLNDNVASATKLQTARTIWGQSFDGTGNVSGDFVAHYVKIYDDNVIEATSNKKLHLNYYATTDMSLCYGGGNVGIGTTSPSQKLHVVGNIIATGGITMYSARKLKNITDERGLSLDELSVIKPTRFTWKDGRDDKVHIGGIADDVQKVLPEVIYKTGEDDTLTMDYGNAAFAIAASLIKPVVNHEERIRLLEEENKRLKEEVEQLKWIIA